MASLSVQTLKHLSLEEILNIGFDRLPRNDEFYKAVAQKLKETEVETYYNKVGWSKFEDDLLFLINNEGKPLIYKRLKNHCSFCIYWCKANNKYKVIAAKITYYTVSIIDYESLEETIAELFRLIISFPFVPSQGREPKPKLKQGYHMYKEIFDFMYLKKKDVVTELVQHLTSGKTITIDGQLNLSFPPFSNNSLASIIYHKGTFNIIGIRYDEMFVAYGMQFSQEEIYHVLAILVYNEDSYEL